MNIDTHIQLVADSISEVRKCDVYRLIETADDSTLMFVVDYIKEHRPDLVDEVDACLGELNENNN